MSNHCLLNSINIPHKLLYVFTSFRLSRSCISRLHLEPLSAALGNPTRAHWSAAWSRTALPHCTFNWLKFFMNERLLIVSCLLSIYRYQAPVLWCVAGRLVLQPPNGTEDVGLLASSGGQKHPRCDKQNVIDAEHAGSKVQRWVHPPFPINQRARGQRNGN